MNAESGGPLAVHVHGLVKTYSGTRAVDGVDLDIRRGEIFALLGPNGAGKTTTVEILEGYRSRDSGEVTVLGYDPGRQRAPLKRKIGIVLQSTGVEPYLIVTGRQAGGHAAGSSLTAQRWRQGPGHYKLGVNCFTC